MRAYFVFFCLLSWSLDAASQSIPLTAVNRAAEVIDRAIAAHGGAEVLNGIKTAIQKPRFKTFATNQSLKPGPPWDESWADNVYAVDFENQRVFNSNKGTGGGFITDAATLITTDEGFNIDYRAGTLTPLAQFDFHTVAGPFVRISPTLLVRSLMLRRHTSHWLGEADVGGKTTDVVTLVMEAGPALSLYIDKVSGLLVQAERVFPPFGQVMYHYLDYKTVDGIPVNQRLELFANGEPNLIVEPGELTFNKPVDAYLALPANLKRTETQQPDPMTATKLAEGVHLIGGSGTYALFIETGDQVVAVGGAAGITERIAELRGLGVKKPVRTGVITTITTTTCLGLNPIGWKAHRLSVTQPMPK